MINAASGKGPLQNIRVLDLAAGFAGPFASTMLGDFGADVIKVERPQTGDFAREYGPANQVWWKTLARGKRSVAIDLKHASAPPIMKRLVEASDVFIESFRPGVIERLNMSPHVLHEWNPDLIILRVSGYGQTGPYSSKPGFGRAAEAFSGLLYLSGFPDGPPMHPGFAMGDMTTGLMGAYGVMVALHARSQGLSRGQVIDLALYEATLRLMDFPIPVTTGSDVKPERVGNKQPMSYALSNIFCAKDGRWLMYSAASFSIAKRVLRLVGGEAYANDPRFETFRDMCSHEKEIDERIAAWIAERTAAEAVDAFTREEAVAALIYSPEDIVADPHIAARQSIIGFPGERAKFVNVVPKLSDTPGSIHRLGPMKVGEDSLQILREVAAYDDESLTELLESNVIVQA